MSFAACGIFFPYPTTITTTTALASEENAAVVEVDGASSGRKIKAVVEYMNYSNNRWIVLMKNVALFVPAPSLAIETLKLVVLDSGQHHLVLDAWKNGVLQTSDDFLAAMNAREMAVKYTCFESSVMNANNSNNNEIPFILAREDETPTVLAFGTFTKSHTRKKLYRIEVDSLFVYSLESKKMVQMHDLSFHLSFAKGN